LQSVGDADQSRDPLAMSSVDYVTPTPEVDNAVSVTSSRRRSSLSCDGDESELSSLRLRRGSFRGSVTSLGPEAPQWRRESIVEALEKKCRANISSRLRSHLPQHLHKSSTSTCYELPVIVRQATSTLPRPTSRLSGLTQSSADPSRRSTSQLYQAVTLGRVDGRHCTALSSSTSDRCTRSLSLCRQPRRGSDDVRERSETSSTLDRPLKSENISGCAEDERVNLNLAATLHPTEFHQPDRLFVDSDDPTTEKSASSLTVVRSCTTSKESDRTKDQRITLPTKLLHQPDQSEMLQQSSDDQSEPASMCSLANGGQCWTESKQTTRRVGPHQSCVADTDEEPAASRYSTSTSSSVDTGGTTDLDLNPDSTDTDTDSCDDESVHSFTFSPSASRPHLDLYTTSGPVQLCTSSNAVLRQIVATVSGAGSNEVSEVDSSNAASTTSSTNDEFQTNNLSANIALTDGQLTTSDMTAKNVGSDRTNEVHNEALRPDENEATASCGGDGQAETDNVIELVSTTRKDIPVEMAKSISDGELCVAGGEERRCEGRRYRTSLSLSLSSPRTTINRLIYHSAPHQPPQNSFVEQSRPSVSDDDDLLPSAAVTLAAPAARAQWTAPAVTESRQSYSHDDDHQLNGHAAASRLAVNINAATRHHDDDDDDDDVTAGDERWSNDTHESSSCDAVGGLSVSHDEHVNHVFDVRPTSAGTWCTSSSSSSSAH